MSRLTEVLGIAVAGAIAFAASPALAYIGPGAGLSLLGALWGVLAAVFAALAFLLFWPMRRLLRRQKAAAKQHHGIRRDDATEIPSSVHKRR